MTSKKKIGIEKLQAPMQEGLVGRDDIQHRLWKALEDDRVAVVGITAPGGTGKSAVVRAWLEKVRLEIFDSDCACVWKFPDLGAGTTASSDGFFTYIFRTRCGSDDSSPASEESKAQRLFKAFSQQRSILVLDSLEYLQRYTSKPKGEMFDIAMRSFLTKVAALKDDQRGRLVVVTSREPLIDLHDEKVYPDYRKIDLEALDDEDGAELLSSMGIVGLKGQLLQASHDYGGNALALVLLGRLIKSSAFDDDHILNRDRIDLFADPQTDAQEDRLHAQRIFEFYEAKVGKPEEIVMLRMMALLRHSLAAPEREILLKRAKFARHVSGLTDGDWQACCKAISLNKLPTLLVLSPACRVA